jgi:hypothetical protein
VFRFKNEYKISMNFDMRTSTSLTCLYLLLYSLNWDTSLFDYYVHDCVIFKGHNKILETIKRAINSLFSFFFLITHFVEDTWNRKKGDRNATQEATSLVLFVLTTVRFYSPTIRLE